MLEYKIAEFLVKQKIWLLPSALMPLDLQSDTDSYSINQPVRMKFHGELVNQ